MVFDGRGNSRVATFGAVFALGDYGEIVDAGHAPLRTADVSGHFGAEGLAVARGGGLANRLGTALGLNGRRFFDHHRAGCLPYLSGRLVFGRLIAGRLVAADFIAGLAAAFVTMGGVLLELGRRRLGPFYGREGIGGRYLEGG